MMPWECKSPSDVAIYVLANLKEPVKSQNVCFENQMWSLCLAYHEDLHHLNLYRNTSGTRFAFHAGRSWYNVEPPNMGVYDSIGELIDAIVSTMWKRWELKPQEEPEVPEEKSIEQKSGQRDNDYR